MNTSKAFVLLLASVCSSALAADPILIVNEDNDHYFKLDSSKMTVAELEAYIDFFKGTKVTHFFMCPNGQRTSYRSKVHEAIWDDVAGKTPTDIWPVNAKKLFDAGIDPYKVWIDCCRKDRISPWIAMRMNDVHYPTTKNYFRHVTMFENRPDLRRKPYPGEGGWYPFEFDYAIQEVRDYHFALVKELFERYDFDGFEMDWLRHPYHLSAGREKEDAHFLTEFVRHVRDVADQWGAKWGHKIQVGCRVPTHPDNAVGLGYEAFQWAKLGIVNMIVASCEHGTNDYDIPVRLWQSRLAEVGEAGRVQMVYGCDNGTQGFPGAYREEQGPGLYNGWAASLKYQGANAFYLFNYVYRPYREGDYRKILETGWSDDFLETATRICPVSYRDVGPWKCDNGAQLPVTLQKPATFKINAGKKPAQGKVFVKLHLKGLASDAADETKIALDVKLNGVGPASDELNHDAWRKKNKPVHRYDWEFPFHACKSGQNEVRVEHQPGSPWKVLWVEIRIDGRRS